MYSAPWFQLLLLLITVNMDPIDVTLSFTPRESGEVFREMVKVRQVIKLPGNRGGIVVN
jgi:hypothetical protein